MLAAGCRGPALVPGHPGTLARPAFQQLDETGLAGSEGDLIASPSPQNMALEVPKCLLATLREPRASQSPRLEAHPVHPRENPRISSAAFFMRTLLAYLLGWETHSCLAVISL